MSLNSKLILCLLSLGFFNSVSAGAPDFDANCQGRSGNAGTNKSDMCKCTNNYLTQLDKSDTSFENEKKELQAIQAQASIVNGTRNLVNQYKQELKNLATPTSKAQLPVKLIEYKRAIEDAVLLNSINSFISKNKNLIEEKDFDIKKLCATHSKDKEYKFLCEYEQKEDHWYSKSYIDTIKRFIEAYKIAQTAGDNKLLDDKIKSIISDIPQNNSPEFVMQLEENFSPELKTSMNNVTAEFDQLCVNEKVQGHMGCEPKYLNFTPVTNENIIKEMNDFSAKVASNDQSQNDRKLSINNQIQTFIKDNLKDKFKAFESIRSSEIGDSFNAYVKPRKNFGLDAFKEMSIKIKSINGNDDLNFSNNASEFTTKCIGDNPQKFSALSDYDKTVRMNECNNIIQKLYDTFSDDNVKEINEKLHKAQEKFLAKMNSPEARNLNLIKNFVANNYLRNCSNKDATIDTVKGCPNDVLSPISNFKLGNQTFNIIGNITSQSDVDSAFSTSELNDARSFCTKNFETYRLACTNIYREYENSKGQKTNKEWADLHDKYWVKYDNNARGGYTLTEKKSIGRMFGEALVPAISNVLPYALYNYSASANIESMQQQAMMQKQWMWDANQANTYWLNNYFSTSTTSTPTFTSTNSYNFSN